MAVIEETPTSTNCIHVNNDNGDRNTDQGSEVNMNNNIDTACMNEGGKHKVLSPLLLTGLMYTLTTSGAYGIE